MNSVLGHFIRLIYRTLNDDSRKRRKIRSPPKQMHVRRCRIELKTIDFLVNSVYELLAYIDSLTERKEEETLVAFS